MIKCIKCNTPKSEECFYYDKNANRHQTKCKACVKLYYQDRKDKFKEYNKEYRESHKEYFKEYLTQYRESHGEYHKNYYQANKEHYKELAANWRKDPVNRAKHNNTAKIYRKHRKLIDPAYAFKISMRSAIKKMFKTHSTNGKLYSSKKYGIDVSAVFSKIGPKPSSDYHMDHIIPLCVFNLDNPAHPGLANSPYNLRWVLGSDNVKKHDTIDYDLIIQDEELLKIACYLGITKDHHGLNGRDVKGLLNI